MTENAVWIPPDRLRAATRAIIEAGGSSSEEAEVVADHLVLANLSGHDSHGVGMLPRYVVHLKKGLLVPNQDPELIREDGPFLIFDGRRGYGQAGGRIAMTRAIEHCSSSGLVLMTLRNAHHLGRIGTYAEQAVSAGLVSLHFVNVTDHPPFVAPFRGSDARFSTNPICLAMPGSASQPPVILDMATSRIAHGKARVAYNKNEPVVSDALIDAQGQPTRDPAVLFSRPPGALLPFGIHKGYGLALFGELLGGLLSGGGTAQPEREPQGSILNNMLTVVIDPQRLVETPWMDHELEAIVAHCKASPAASPDEPVLVPGDPERIARAERADAIEVDGESWEQILSAGEELGVGRDTLLDLARPLTGGER